MGKQLCRVRMEAQGQIAELLGSKGWWRESPELWALPSSGEEGRMQIESFFSAAEKGMNKAQSALMLEGQGWADELLTWDLGSDRDVAQASGFMAREHSNGGHRAKARVTDWCARFGWAGPLEAALSMAPATVQGAAQAFDAFCWSLAFGREDCAKAALEALSDKLEKSPELRGVWLLEEWANRSGYFEDQSRLSLPQLARAFPKQFAQLQETGLLSGEECYFFAGMFAKGGHEEQVLLMREMGWWLNLQQRKALAKFALEGGHKQLADKLTGFQAAWAIEQGRWDEEMESFGLPSGQQAADVALKEAMDNPGPCLGRGDVLLSAAFAGETEICARLLSYGLAKPGRLAVALNAAVEAAGRAKREERRRGALECAGLLLEAGADANRVDFCAHAAQRGSVGELGELAPIFLARGKDPQDLLACACAQGDLATARLALEYGAQAREQEMRWAALNGQKQTVRFLVNSGFGAEKLGPGAFKELAMLDPEAAQKCLEQAKFGFFGAFKKLAMSKCIRELAPAVSGRKAEETKAAGCVASRPLRHAQGPLGRISAQAAQLGIEAKRLGGLAGGELESCAASAKEALSLMGSQGDGGDWAALEATVCRRIPALLESYKALEKSGGEGLEMQDGKTPQELLLEGLAGAREALEKAAARQRELAGMELAGNAAVLGQAPKGF